MAEMSAEMQKKLLEIYLPSDPSVAMRYKLRTALAAEDDARERTEIKKRYMESLLMVNVEFAPLRDLELLPDGAWHCRKCNSDRCEHLAAHLGEHGVGANVLAKFIGSYAEEVERTADIILPTDTGDELHVDFRRTSTRDVWECVMIGPSGVEIALTMIAVGTDSFDAIEKALEQVTYIYMEDGATCASKEHFKRSKDVLLSTNEDVFSYMVSGLCKKCASGKATDFDKFVPEADASMPSVWSSTPKPLPPLKLPAVDVGAAVADAMKNVTDALAKSLTFFPNPDVGISDDDAAIARSLYSKQKP